MEFRTVEVLNFNALDFRQRKLDCRDTGAREAVEKPMVLHKNVTCGKFQRRKQPSQKPADKHTVA